MIRFSFLSIIILFCLQGATEAESSRLKRILREYEGERFYHATRQISLEAGYIKHNEDPRIDSLFGPIDTLKYFSRTLGADVGYLNSRHEENFEGRFFSQAAAAIRVFSRNDGFSLKGKIDDSNRSDPGLSPGQRFDRRDTIGNDLLLRAGYQRDHTRYLSFPRPGFPTFFYQLNGRATLTGGYRKEENTEPPLPDSLVDGKYIARDFTAAALVEVEPGIGLGKTVNISPVFLALELEHELKRCGAINFSLSDQTVARIAQLLALQQGNDLRNRVTFMRFKSELDSIVSRDMAAEYESLGRLGLFAVQRIVLRNMPLFFAGPRWRLFLREQMLFQKRISRYSYPYEENSDHDVRTTDRFPHRIELNSSFSWGIALSDKFLFSPKIQKTFYSSQEGLEFYEKGKVDWGDLVEYDLSLGFTWIPALWFSADFGIDGQALKGVIPSKDPAKIYVDGTIYIEDKIAIQLDLSYNNIEESATRSEGDSLYLHGGFGITLRAFYNF